MTNEEPSLFKLVGQLPETVSNLVKAEIGQVKAELTHKAKHYGVGSVFFIVALVILPFLVFTLLAAAIFALALVMPGWAAALTVSGAILLVIVVLVLLGILRIKLGSEEIQSVSSIKADLHALKGTGDYDRRS